MPDPHPNSVEDFAARFRALSMEAHRYGISSIFAVNDSDHLTREDRAFFGYAGGKFTAAGLASALLSSLNGHPPQMEGEEA